MDNKVTIVHDPTGHFSGGEFMPFDFATSLYGEIWPDGTICNYKGERWLVINDFKPTKRAHPRGCLQSLRDAGLIIYPDSRSVIFERRI
jgi:hypothetical protein